MSTKWIELFRHWVAPRPVLKGVWRRRDGGYLVRGRAKGPDGKQRAVVRVVSSESAATARTELERLLDLVRSGQEERAQAPTAAVSQSPPTTSSEPSKTLFAVYARSLLERKVREGRIRSAGALRQWKYVLKRVLVPAFGARPVAELRRAEILAWRDTVAARIAAGKLAPRSGNTWLKVLRTIVTEFVVEFELERNPVLKVPDFDLSTWHTYTEEEPNSLTPEEVPRFLAAARELYPQHYAFIVLLFSTGLRPSSLRPLRRRGPEADILWETGELLVRRSHSRTQRVMEKTKTGIRQRIPLPEELMEVLRWHVKALDATGEGSDLLFPSRVGKLRADSGLDEPFKRITTAAGISKRISPRAGRRTFQDLARAAEVKDIVTRAVSGHATENMQRHYSTVASAEVSAGLARVIELAKVRETFTRSSPSAPPAEASAEAPAKAAGRSGPRSGPKRRAR